MGTILIELDSADLNPVKSLLDQLWADFEKAGDKPILIQFSSGVLSTVGCGDNPYQCCARHLDLQELVDKLVDNAVEV